MKIILTTLTLLLMLSTAVAAENWELVNYPVADKMIGIAFISPDTVFTVNTAGGYAVSRDGCKNWDLFTLTNNIAIEDIAFRTAEFGVICGPRGMLMNTMDGGASWYDHTFPDTLAWFFDVIILNDSVCLASGMIRKPKAPATGILVRSVNRGNNFSVIDAPGMGYSEMFHGSDGTLYLLSFGQLNYSTDQGLTWKSRPLGLKNPVRSISKYGSAGVVCSPGLVAYTLDGGITWIKADVPEDAFFVAAEMINDSVGYVGGPKSTMYRTDDGGRSWAQELLPAEFDILDMCVEGQYLYAVGSEGTVIRKKVR